MSFAPITVPDTRTRILDVAERLLLTRGFNAFSYQHVAQELGIKSAAIHYHYPSKDDLGTTIIRRQRGRLRKWQQLPQIQALSPPQQLEALLSVYRKRLYDEQGVCLFGALASSFQALPAPMQEELRRFNEELTSWLAGVLAAGRTAGTLGFRGKATGKAAQVLVALAGALQVARIHDEQHFQLILDQIQQDLLPE